MGGVAAQLLASCSSGGPLPDQAGPSRPSSSAPSPSTTTTVPPTTTTMTVPGAPGWTTLSTGPRGIAIDERTFSQPDGSQVTVARFLFNHVDYSLHVGIQDPPTGHAAIGPDSGPMVAWSPSRLMDGEGPVDEMSVLRADQSDLATDRREMRLAHGCRLEMACLCLFGPTADAVARRSTRSASPPWAPC
jgi:hypothetical protein